MGLWETAKQFVEGAKTRTKVLSALDKGRLTALVPNFRSKDPLSDFMTRWITKTFEDISAATSGAGLDGFQHEKASEVFHALVAAGGVPHSLIQEWGQPPEVWQVIVKEYVTDLYSYLFTSYSERNWMTMVDFTP